jgi:hypothetical protein
MKWWFVPNTAGIKLLARFRAFLNYNLIVFWFWFWILFFPLPTYLCGHNDDIAFDNSLINRVQAWALSMAGNSCHVIVWSACNREKAWQFMCQIKMCCGSLECNAFKWICITLAALWLTFRHTLRAHHCWKLDHWVLHQPLSSCSLASFLGIVITIYVVNTGLSSYKTCGKYHLLILIDCSPSSPACNSSSLFRATTIIHIFIMRFIATAATALTLASGAIAGGL